ncbi:MAG TPA: cytochrome c [Caulobacteraceae bacterium]|jgi:mono/diheme cytochrome c family protein|nr:cytochrome c [Caulobacteraceae bacterium]
MTKPPFKLRAAAFAPRMVVAVCALLCGCAGAPGAPDEGPAVARGALIAEQACRACHATGLVNASRFPGAPPFRNMRLRRNAVSYERRMAQMHLGRLTMPPAEISLQDVDDIAAYVRSLRAPTNR